MTKTTPSIDSFTAMPISPEILKSLERLGFEVPTPVQQAVIPLLLERRRDLIGLAQTGTGKTAAFGIPLVQQTDAGNPRTQALVLCPTRELCIQVAGDLSAIAHHVPRLRVVAVYGGADIVTQIRALRRGAQIVVATPGRLCDLIRRDRIGIKQIATVVLDEADEMLDMGFKEELSTILAETPESKNSLLFAATMDGEVAAIARTYLRDPVQITVGKANSGADSVRHTFYVVAEHNRYPALKRLLDLYPGIYGMVFCRTRQQTQEVADQLIQDGYNAGALHGDLSQAMRDQIMNRFRCRTLQVLVATDVAARGLDVNDLTHVINYTLPDDISVYTHRTGRTGRAGKKGMALSLVSPGARRRVLLIERSVGKPIARSQLPTGREVCEKQLLHLMNEIRQVDVNPEQIAPFLPALLTRLEDLDREELIRRLVVHQFRRLLDYYDDARDLNVQERPRTRQETRRPVGEGKGRGRSGGGDPRRRFTVLHLNVGTDDGVHAARLIGHVNDVTEMRWISFGQIDVFAHETYIEADSRFLDQVVAALDLQINGKIVRVEVMPGGAYQPETRAPRVKQRPSPGPRSGNKGGRTVKGSKSRKSSRYLKQ